jgi:hypothetical protein
MADTSKKTASASLPEPAIVDDNNIIITDAQVAELKSRCDEKGIRFRSVMKGIYGIPAHRLNGSEYAEFSGLLNGISSKKRR